MQTLFLSFKILSLEEGGWERERERERERLEKEVPRPLAPPFYCLGLTGLASLTNKLKNCVRFVSNVKVPTEISKLSFQKAVIYVFLNSRLKKQEFLTNKQKAFNYLMSTGMLDNTTPFWNYVSNLKLYIEYKIFLIVYSKICKTAYKLLLHRLIDFDEFCF